MYDLYRKMLVEAYAMSQDATLPLSSRQYWATCTRFVEGFAYRGHIPTEGQIRWLSKIKKDLAASKPKIEGSSKEQYLKRGSK